MATREPRLQARINELSLNLVLQVIPGVNTCGYDPRALKDCAAALMDGFILNRPEYVHFLAYYWFS